MSWLIYPYNSFNVLTYVLKSQLLKVLHFWVRYYVLRTDQSHFSRNCSLGIVLTAWCAYHILRNETEMYTLKTCIYFRYVKSTFGTAFWCVNVFSFNICVNIKSMDIVNFLRTDKNIWQVKVLKTQNIQHHLKASFDIVVRPY